MSVLQMNEGRHRDVKCLLEIVTIDLTCRLDWAIGCPDIWLSILPGVSVRVFLDEMNI